MKRNSILIQLLIFVAIVVVVNLISDKLYFRLDFTADGRYTLSNATKDVLEELEDVATVKAYFSEDLPPQLLSNRKDFQDLLIEYENRSNGNLVYEFINPNVDELSEQDAQQQGISPVVINVTERDQVQQLRAYMGAVIEMGDVKEVIPVIQPGAAMEYDLTTSLKKMAIQDKPKIGFIQGHGEATINGTIQLVQQLSVLYDVEPYTLTDTSSIPSYYRAIALIDPSDTIPDSQFAIIDDFISQGGNVFVSFSAVSGDMRTAYLQPAPDLGIKNWLANKGVTVGDNFVIDAACGSVSVRQQQGPFVFNAQIQFPYFPIVQEFAEHPISQGLEALVLPFVTNISINNQDSSLSIVPLAYSSESSGLQSPGRTIDINKKWAESDFPLSNEVLAVALDGTIGNNPNARMVVIPNGSFAVNGEGQSQQQLSPDNVNFASNAIDWLSDDTGLIDLRTKGVTSRPLDKLEDGTRNILKYGNVFLPIILILVYSFVRKQRNNKRKQDWMQGKY